VVFTEKKDRQLPTIIGAVYFYIEDGSDGLSEQNKMEKKNRTRIINKTTDIIDKM
jgi:hypothetical protein